MTHSVFFKLTNILVLAYKVYNYLCQLMVKWPAWEDYHHHNIDTIATTFTTIKLYK